MIDSAIPTRNTETLEHIVSICFFHVLHFGVLVARRYDIS